MIAVTLEFHPPAVACKWPEGSSVAAVQMRRGKPDWRTFSVHAHHRPDWLDVNGDGFSRHFAQYHYALLKRKA